MKRFNIKNIIISSCVLSVIFSACLKDDDYDNGSIQSTDGSDIKPIELKLTASNATNFFVLAVDNSGTDTTVDLVPVNLAAKSAATEDLHVTIALDSNLVIVFDTTGTAAGNPGGDYEVPANKMFTVVNPVVTIPKGSHTAYLQIKFKPSDFIGKNWALGFKITSIQEKGYVISGNLSTGIVALIIKNQYDGLYYAHGYFSHPTLGGPFSFDELPLSTSGSNSVDMEAQPYGVNSLLGAYPRLTVNADNSVTVTSADPASPFNGPFDPNYHSHYDPDKKTFYINFGYTTSAPRTAYDTLEYVGPR